MTTVCSYAYQRWRSTSPQETVADGEELGARPLGDLADLPRLGREPVVEQGEGAVGVDQLLGIVVVGAISPMHRSCSSSA